MIPTAFEYQRATSVDDAVAKLKAGGKLLAGGHSLIPLMKLRLSEPGTLIDIARIPGLAGIREKDGKIEIGAATVHHDVATSALLRDKSPFVAEAASDIGRQRPHRRHAEILKDEAHDQQCYDGKDGFELRNNKRTNSRETPGNDRYEAAPPASASGSANGVI